MIKSPFATKYTQEMQAGKSNPSVDPKNYKALQEPQRRRAWEERQASAKD